MLPHDENLETESQNRSTVKENYDLQLEQAAEIMGKANARNKKRNKANSKERPSHSEQHDSSHASFQEEKYSSNRPSSKNYSTKHAVISFGEPLNQGSHPQIFSSEFDNELIEEKSPGEDIGAALGFSSTNKNKKKTLLGKKAPGGLKNITNAIAVDLDEDLKPNSALGMEPQAQPKLQTDKISLTLTTYKPKQRDTNRDMKTNLQKSSDGFKNTSRSIESLPLERSIEGMGSSLYGSNYHISAEQPNLRSSKVLKKETSVGKNKSGLVSPKPSNTKNQRYFQQGKNASGGKLKK